VEATGRFSVGSVHRLVVGVSCDVLRYGVIYEWGCFVGRWLAVRQFIKNVFVDTVTCKYSNISSVISLGFVLKDNTIFFRDTVYGNLVC
jgi:hypothetical protein